MGYGWNVNSLEYTCNISQSNNEPTPDFILHLVHSIPAKSRIYIYIYILIWRNTHTEGGIRKGEVGLN